MFVVQADVEDDLSNIVGKVGGGVRGGMKVEFYNLITKCHQIFYILESGP